jgi:hypothetical protein
MGNDSIGGMSALEACKARRMFFDKPMELSWPVRQDQLTMKTNVEITLK